MTMLNRIPFLLYCYKMQFNIIIVIFLVSIMALISLTSLLCDMAQLDLTTRLACQNRCPGIWQYRGSNWLALVSPSQQPVVLPSNNNALQPSLP